MGPMTAASDGSGLLWRRQAQLWVLMAGTQLFDRQTPGHALCASRFCVFSQPFSAGPSAILKEKASQKET